VRNFPAGDRTWRVSAREGRQPHWRRDGRELFYLTQDGTLMAVEVKANALKKGAVFEFGPPRALFRTGVPTLVRSTGGSSQSLRRQP
jgi:eukaryotic-like serine/threonine-protein kinase